jgi:cytochrome c-type biogenesis protein CcmE
MDAMTPGSEPPIVPSERSSSGNRTRTWVTTSVAILAFVAVGAVLYKGLSDATLFFRNADEAVAQRDSLGDKRFNLQGLVVADSVSQQGDLVLFSIVFNDVQVDVAHEGAPPQLFQEGIPVVLEGHFVEGASPEGVSFAATDGTSGDGYYYASDRILVKHDNEYDAENPDRVEDSLRGGSE